MQHEAGCAQSTSFRRVGTRPEHCPELHRGRRDGSLRQDVWGVELGKVGDTHAPFPQQFRHEETQILEMTVRYPHHAPPFIDILSEHAASLLQEQATANGDRW